MVLALVGAGIYFGLQYWQSRNSNLPAAAPSPTPAVANNNVAAPSPTPALPSVTEGLKVQVKATSQTVNVTPIIDGKQLPSVNLQPNEAKEFSAQKSVNIQYAKSLASTLEVTVNGRPATVKTVSDNPKRKNSIEMDITRENFAQYLK
jgi:hypothetical protein